MNSKYFSLYSPKILNLVIVVFSHCHYIFWVVSICPNTLKLQFGHFKPLSIKGLSKLFLLLTMWKVWHLKKFVLQLLWLEKLCRITNIRKNWSLIRDTKSKIFSANIVNFNVFCPMTTPLYIMSCFKEFAKHCIDNTNIVDGKRSPCRTPKLLKRRRVLLKLWKKRMYYYW